MSRGTFGPELKGLGFEGPLTRQKWLRHLFVNTSLRPLSPYSSGNERMCASIRIYFVTFVQNLESSIQRTRKIGVKNFWEEELADGRHAILLYGDSVL